MRTAPSFARLVAEAMERRGLGLRELCRRAGLDPSLLSKILAGKRNPPSEEEPLRRLADVLQLDAVELIVSAGRIPSDWSALWADPGLVRAVHRLAAGAGRPRTNAAAGSEPSARRVALAAPAPAPRVPGGGLSEELL